MKTLLARRLRDVAERLDPQFPKYFKFHNFAGMDGKGYRIDRYGKFWMDDGVDWFREDEGSIGVRLGAPLVIDPTAAR